VDGSDERGNDSRARAAAAPARDAWLRVIALAAVLVLAVAVAPRAHAKTYKWVDDKGEVHYTDKLPPEAFDKANIELDKAGRPIRKNDPPPTAEQRKAKADEDARQKQLAAERAIVERRDRALLATYTVESEIDLARNRALSTIDAQVQSSTVYNGTLSKRKAELESTIAALGNKPVPAVTERELANINSELAKQAEFLATKQKEIGAVNAKYDADKKRWTELRAATEAQANGTARPAAMPSPAPAGVRPTSTTVAPAAPTSKQ
jgi:hypothetical protein